MADKLIRSYAKGCLSRTALSLLLTVAAFIMLGVCMVGLALIPERWLSPNAKAMLIAACIPVGGITLTLGIVAVVLLNNQRIYTQFDQAFTPLGLTRSRYLLSGLQYRGTYRERQVNVYYYVSGRRYLRVPDLQIYLSGNFRTRLGIVSQNALTSLGGALMRQQPITVNDPAYEGLLIYPLDEIWSRRLLSEPQASEAILRLVGKEEPGVRSLTFSPDSIRLQLRHFQLSILAPDVVRRWVDDLLALTEIAEGLLPPTQTAEVSEWEWAGRSDRSRFLLPAIAIVAVIFVGVLVIMSLCITMLFFLDGFS